MTNLILLYPFVCDSSKAETLGLCGQRQVAYFVNSGSEANDMAMTMARLYTGNFDMLTLRNGYHGLSAGTMGLLSHSTWKPNLPTGEHAPLC